MVGIRLVMKGAIDAKLTHHAMTAYRASVHQLVGHIESLVEALRKTG
jgi:hypothetical protein